MLYIVHALDLFFIKNCSREFTRPGVSRKIIAPTLVRVRRTFTVREHSSSNNNVRQTSGCCNVIGRIRVVSFVVLPEPK